MFTISFLTAWQVARFNHSHRVSDVRRFIRASRPDLVVSRGAARDRRHLFVFIATGGLPNLFPPAHINMQGHYQLMTAFPSQLIQEEGRTLEEAGLLNAVLIVKNA